MATTPSSVETKFGVDARSSARPPPYMFSRAGVRTESGSQDASYRVSNRPRDASTGRSRIRLRHTMRATVKEKQEIAKGTLLVTFDLLGEEVDFQPGQYFFVTLPDLGHQDDRLRRHITVVTSPNEKGVLGLATRLRDTAFKNTLQEVSVGPKWRSSRRRASSCSRRTRHDRSSSSRAASGSPCFAACSLHPRGEAPLPRHLDLLEPRP